MNLYQTYEVSTLPEVDFPACNNPTTIEDAFDAAARKQADNWLTYDYEGLLHGKLRRLSGQI